MKAILFVFLGGGLGSLVRFLSSKLIPISKATGMEEDKNKNYIPDWIEKKFPSIFKSGKDLE